MGAFGICTTLLASMVKSKGSVALSSVALPFRANFPNIQDAVGDVACLVDVRQTGNLSFPSTQPPMAADLLSFMTMQLVAAYCESLEVTKKLANNVSGLTSHLLEL